MWKEEINMECVYKSERIICCEVKDLFEGKNWRMVGCYGSPHFHLKRDFWSGLGEFLETFEVPWILFGDLNELVEASEKWGDKDFKWKNLFLKKFLNKNGVVDLGFVGRKFTWERKHNATVILKERLDRAVANQSWIHQFPEAIVHHLPLETSDHVPY